MNRSISSLTLLMLWDELHSCWSKTTNQGHEEGLSAVNQPHALADKCIKGEKLLTFIGKLLRLRPGFLTPEEADWMLSKLLAELPWSQKTNYRLGEAYDEPRLTCWYGELPYTYARSTMAANTQWHPLLVALREAVEQASGCTFNSLLCNLYRDGHDGIGWHSDDEASLGPEPTIASLSLGDTRVFSLRKQPSAEDDGDYTYVERIRIPLSHGTLLLMEGATQDDWQAGFNSVLIRSARFPQPSLNVYSKIVMCFD
uniref:AlkB homolog 3, alpha-ketoglutarate dependent dioxygenase n=1 Tax=Xiphophorus couchianus TaxID=32473 RepID=A0A3B5KZ91_9TELE